MVERKRLAIGNSRFLNELSIATEILEPEAERYRAEGATVIFVAVNGKVWPFFNVEPRRYRFLIINGSNARTYEMSLVDPRPAEIEATLTLRPRGGLPVHITRTPTPTSTRRTA